MPRNGAYYLSEFQGKKVRIKCDACGLRRQYDGTELFNRIGDWNMVALRIELAKRNGCAKSESPSIYDRCKVQYDFGP